MRRSMMVVAFMQKARRGPRLRGDGRLPGYPALRDTLDGVLRASCQGASGDPGADCNADQIVGPSIRAYSRFKWSAS